jgi:hypothetical protein
MIRTVVLNDINFKTIMHHIHKLKEPRQAKTQTLSCPSLTYLNVASACKVFDELIHMRLFQQENQQWVEKAVITRVWFSTGGTPADDVLENLHELFDTVNQRSKTVFTAPAAHATQTLLWKRVEAASKQEQTCEAESWCKLCLHPLFENSGAQNRAKVTR